MVALGLLQRAERSAIETLQTGTVRCVEASLLLKTKRINGQQLSTGGVVAVVGYPPLADEIDALPSDTTKTMEQSVVHRRTFRLNYAVGYRHVVSKHRDQAARLQGLGKQSMAAAFHSAAVVGLLQLPAAVGFVGTFRCLGSCKALRICIHIRTHYH